MAAKNENVTRDFITVKQAAAQVGKSYSTLYKWIHNGYLPAYRVGRALRVNIKEFKRFCRQAGF